jgi:peptide chain release factor 3
VFHRQSKQVFLFDAEAAGSTQSAGAEIVSMTVTGIDDPLLEKELDDEGYRRLREESELLEAAGDAFQRARFEIGEVSPMFFGSAMNNFGIAPFLDAFCELMPSPPARTSNIGVVDPIASEFTGFIFKIQANMDRAHRDRVAFLRICSGRYERGMKVFHVRSSKDMRLSNPTTFVAQERTIVEEAWAGDVLGIYDPGVFEIGDTLTAGARLQYEEIPSFAPEHFARVVMIDPLRRKQLKKGLEQLSQEGTIQLYRPLKGREGDTMLGAVGQLQLEVVKYRLKSEYDVDVRLEPISCEYARWLSREDGGEIDMEAFRRAQVGIAAEDGRGRPVALFQGDWQLNSAKRQFPDITFAETARGVIASSV